MLITRVNEKKESVYYDGREVKRRRRGK